MIAREQFYGHTANAKLLRGSFSRSPVMVHWSTVSKSLQEKIQLKIYTYDNTDVLQIRPIILSYDIRVVVRIKKACRAATWPFYIMSRGINLTYWIPVTIAIWKVAATAVKFQKSNGVLWIIWCWNIFLYFEKQISAKFRYVVVGWFIGVVKWKIFHGFFDLGELCFYHCRHLSVPWTLSN